MRCVVVIPDYDDFEYQLEEIEFEDADQADVQGMQDALHAEALGYTEEFDIKNSL